ncbi:MAG TPA: lipid II flippase MurJ [Acidobacteriota bacterium]|nr:lipid II flippase MurJ [Acidobacteriota bacterium]
MSSRLLKQSLLAASAVTIVAGILGRLFGYTREAIVAGYFGTSGTFDTFILASTVPEFVAGILFAAIPTAVVPWLNSVCKSSPEQEASLFRRGLAVFGIVFGSLAVLIFIFRALILQWLAPFLGADQTALGVSLMGILAWTVFFRGLEAYFRGWLYGKKHFVIPSISPFVMNAAVVGCVLLLYGRLDIQALAIGWLAGAVMLFCVNGAFVLTLLGPSQPASRAGVHVSALLRLALAVAVIESVSLAYPAVDRFLAARYLGEGQIAALRYAVFLTQLAPGILVVTFSLAAFPWITEMSAPSQQDRLRELYRHSVRAILSVMVLVAAAMVLFSQDIVRIAFQRGAFDAASSHLTATAFRYYALGILLYSVYIYQMRFYYARRAMVRLGMILLFMLLVKVGASMLLVRPLEHDGLALATSVAWLVGFLVMSVDLARTFGLKVAREDTRLLARLVPIIALVVVFWAAVGRAWPANDMAPLLWQFLRLAVIAAAGAGIYFGLGVALGIPESQRIVSFVRSRFGGAGGPGR